ncbi:hypothetical protein WA538_002375 [Blastocystis sp. DL]
MSARMGARTARMCSQSVRMMQKAIRTPRPFEQMPKMQMKSVLKSSQMEMLSKKMSALPKYAKMNRSELQRIQIATMTMLVTSSSSVILNLAEVLSSVLCQEEDEEGSSSSVWSEGLRL